jgi:hypothetical protein
MPKHTRARHVPPASAGRLRHADSLRRLRRGWRSLRGWQRPRVVAAGIAASAAAAALVAPALVAPKGMPDAGAAWAVWWCVPVIAAGSLLAGLVFGSYVRAPIGAEATVCDTRWPLLGLAGLALGTSPGPDGLLAYLFSWAAPAVLAAVIQPAVALASLALLGWALRLRLDLERTALPPPGEAPFGGEACPSCRPLFPDGLRNGRP